MKKILEFFGRKKRILELEREVNDLTSQLERIAYNVNNFPPCAITAIPNSQLEEIFKSDEENKLEQIKQLILSYVRFIEQHDLKVDYMFIPRKLNERFCKNFGCKKSFWGIKVIPVTGLNNSIFISNVEASEDYITLFAEESE
jgi:hypothetical protein